MLSAGAAPWYPHQVSAHCCPSFPSGSPDGKRKGEKVFRTWHKLELPSLTPFRKLCESQQE